MNSHTLPTLNSTLTPHRGPRPSQPITATSADRKNSWVEIERRLLSEDFLLVPGEAGGARPGATHLHILHPRPDGPQMRMGLHATDDPAGAPSPGGRGIAIMNSNEVG